jgi:Protein of unknown function (DUF2474)
MAEERFPSAARPTARDWLKRLGWLVLIWLASVAALGVAAYGLRLLMRSLGMSL